MNKKHKKMLKNIALKGGIPALLVLGLIFGLTHKPKAHALSDRGKKAVGILIGAAAMGATAGAAGGAKWVPLGLFGGGLAGGLIAKGATSGDEYEKLERKKEKLEAKLQKTNSAKRREKLEKQLSSINQELQGYKRR